MEARKIIYLLLAIVIAIPYLRPLGIPVATSKMTRDFYKTLNSLPEGSVVVLCIDVGLGSWIELGPATIAHVQHLFNLPLKILVTGGSTQLPVLWDYTIEKGKINFRDKKYGEDYVVLGFFTGGEAGAAALADNLHLTKTDQYGTPLEEIPIMKDLKTAADVDALVTIMAGTQEEWYLRQWQAPYGTKIGAILSAVVTALAMTYYVSGQLFGIINSLRGGAEYELLINKPGEGVIGTDMLSMSHLLLIGLIIFGNILMLYEKNRGSGTGRREEQL